MQLGSHHIRQGLDHLVAPQMLTISRKEDAGFEDRAFVLRQPQGAEQHAVMEE